MANMYGLTPRKPRLPQLSSLAPPAAPSTATGGTLAPDAPGGAFPSFQPGATGFSAGQFGYDPSRILRAGKIQRGIGTQNYGLMLQALGPLVAAQNSLIQRANTDHFSPEERSAYLAPRLDQLDQGYALQQGALDRNLSRRGLDTSSAAVSEFANLGGRYAADRAGLVNSLFQSEEQRQQQAQAQLLDFLMNLIGRSSNQAASTAGALAQQRLQQQQIDLAKQANQFGFGDVLGGLMGLAGTAGSLGWKPF